MAVSRKREISPGKLFLIRRSFFVFELMLLGGFIYEVHRLKLPVAVDDLFSWLPLAYMRRLIGIIPLIAGMALIRLAQLETERRARRTDWSRLGFLKLNLKLLLLPVIPLLAFLGFNDIISHSPLRVRLFFIDNSYISWLVLASIIVLLFVKAPYILRGIWRATPLKDPELRGVIESLAQKEGVRFKEIMVWHTGEARVANAGVAGLLPWSRRIFLTDYLLENFTPEEIETIVAHEFGHVKYKHIWVYLAFSLSYFSAATLYYSYAEPVYRDLFGGGPIAGAISVLFFFYFYLILLFRLLSRRFEHQADIYAVEVTGKPRVYAFALLKLAELNYVPRAIKRIFELMLTHPSVERRIYIVGRYVGGDPEVAKFRRTLPEVKLIALAVPLTLGLLIASPDKTLFESESDYHYLRGLQFHREGMWDEAIREFSEAIKLNPSDKEAYLARALSYYRSGRLEEAILDLFKLREMVEDGKVRRVIEEMILEIDSERSKKAPG